MISYENKLVLAVLSAGDIRQAKVSSASSPGKFKTDKETYPGEWIHSAVYIEYNIKSLYRATHR